MKITDIKPLKSGNFAVYADGEYVASLDDETLTLSGVARGVEMDGEMLTELVGQANLRKAKQKALRLLGIRDHSKAELQKKLSRSSDGEAARLAAERMEQLGLVDDEAFARKYAAELMLHKLYSRERTVYELTAKGIGRELAEKSADGVGAEPREQAAKLLRKKFPRGLAEKADKRRANALLSRYGYRWDEIREAIALYGTEEEDAD